MLIKLRYILIMLILGMIDTAKWESVGMIILARSPSSTNGGGGGVDGGSSSIGGELYSYGSTTEGRFGNGNLGGEGLRRIIGVVVVGGWWGEYSGAAVGSIQSSPSYRRRIKGKEARR